MIKPLLYKNFSPYNGPILKIFLYHSKEIDLIYKDSTRSSTCGPNSKPTNGDFNILKIGLLSHPRVKLVYTQEEADWIIFHSRNKVGWYSKYHLNSKIIKPEKSIIIDNRDCAYKTLKDNVKFYFKRTILDKRDNSLQKYTQQVYNFPFSARPEYENYNIKKQKNREIDVSVFFNKNLKNKRDRNRRLLAEFILNSQKLSQYKIHVGLVSVAGEKGRIQKNKVYFDYMNNSKIIINCTPNHNEGDFRLWEALCSGSLVISDDISTLKHLLVDKKHLYYYDVNNLPELEDLVINLLKKPKLINKISTQGYKETYKNHLAINRVNYILNIINNE